MNAFCLSADEHSFFEALEHSSSLRFTRQVQHSWYARRAVNEGLLTLSILRQEVRVSLLAKWMKSAETLLDFLAWQLPDPSAELAVCRFEQLTLRARRAAESFKAPDLAVPAGDALANRSVRRPIGQAVINPRSVLKRAEDAGLAFLECDPSLLIAPGLKSVCRVASPQEKRLWAALAIPSPAASLTGKGFPEETIEDMLGIGALELAC